MNEKWVLKGVGLSLGCRIIVNVEEKFGFFVYCMYCIVDMDKFKIFYVMQVHLFVLYNQILFDSWSLILEGLQRVLR